MGRPPRIRDLPEPFVKWVGGKRQLVAELRARLPERFGTYFEPMVGGGALFFSLRPERAVIADVNDELLNVYETIRSDVEALIVDLGKHVNDKEYFYEVRAWEPSTLTAVERASRFIFLNRTCFNGLWRVNSRGKFNVPFGRYAKPRIVDPDNLRAVAELLARAEIVRADFEAVAARATKGDLVYFDPPYHPVSDTAYFTAYTQGGFDQHDQVRLAEVFGALADRGVEVVLSNSDTPFIKELYARHHVHVIEGVRRNVNSKADRRTGFTEVIVTSFRVPSRRR